MRILRIVSAAALLSACGPGTGDGSDQSVSGPADPCPLAAQWHVTGPAGEYGTFLIAPDGRMAWANLGLGEGRAELSGRDLFIHFTASGPDGTVAHDFQVNAVLAEDCQSGQGTLDVRASPQIGLGTYEVTLNRNGDQEAWRQHYALSDAAGG